MRSIRPLLAATGLAAALALTATGCGSDQVSAAPPGAGSSGAANGGADPSQNWDKGSWLRRAEDFINPVIAGLWDSHRMENAQAPSETFAPADASADQGVSDPEPAPVQAVPEKVPYHGNAPQVGKVFFDAPGGPEVCSGTVVKDPRNPGRSNMVWTAGHCVHAGKDGGWFRNITFVPAYNDEGKPRTELDGASTEDLAPFGVYWADWAATSPQWIAQGGPTGGAGSPFDFAVLHVKPPKDGKSLEETVGTAMTVDFNAPDAAGITGMGAWGYPAAPPFDGQIMNECIDRPGRLSISADAPTMWRIGCTMTGGSSGGGWFFREPNGEFALISNTSIGPVTSGWLAGPRLGPVAQQVYASVSDRAATL